MWLTSWINWWFQGNMIRQSCRYICSNLDLDLAWSHNKHIPLSYCINLSKLSYNAFLCLLFPVICWLTISLFICYLCRDKFPKPLLYYLPRLILLWQICSTMPSLVRIRSLYFDMYTLKLSNILVILGVLVILLKITNIYKFIIVISDN